MFCYKLDLAHLNQYEITTYHVTFTKTIDKRLSDVAEHLEIDILIKTSLSLSTV